MPVAIETEIDLPDRLSPVEVGMTCKGVVFALFTIDLWLGKERIAEIKLEATEADFGKFYRTENARTLRGLTVICRGLVGAAVPATASLRCVFRCDDRLYRSSAADIEITQGKPSDIFRIRCPIV